MPVKTMPWNFCLNCHEWGQLHGGGGFLCGACAAFIAELEISRERQLSSNLTVTCLFGYMPPLRNIIIGCKAGSRFANYRYLVRALAEHPAALAAAATADFIVPAPSSLWGRMRGRFDIAHGAAAHLSERTGKSLRSPPWSFSWRLQKRARQRQKRWLPMSTEDPRRRQKPGWWVGKQLLLLDDIVTSGLTMATLANFYQGAKLQGLCLAGSGKLFGPAVHRVLDDDTNVETIF